MDYRSLAKGMGEAVAKRTILRTKDNQIETWHDVARRVAQGNASLSKLITTKDQRWIENHLLEEAGLLEKHIANGNLLMSGRHLQHGDETQITRNLEIFTNCSTATTSFVSFYLLLNGSGVGRAYDNDMCLVDWDYLPNVRVVLDENHPDFVWGQDESLKEAKAKYKNGRVIWHEVADSREGWAKAIETMEVMAYQRKYKDHMLVLDFSKVREAGAPIKGMQDRPSSGPKPLMRALINVSSIKNSDMQLWKQAMWVDHYLAECVLVGGARRSARMSTKYWRDPDIFEFIEIKRGGLLWSSNNSITVDADFWKQDTEHSRRVLEAATKAAYNDMTGEPGFINQDRLHQNVEGMEKLIGVEYVRSKKYKVEPESQKLLDKMVTTVMSKKYTQITNPCGEITLNMLGGYCVIADVVPYHADEKDVLEAFRVATRALMRVNLMNGLYYPEVQRTNRIGVGMTGIHEYAWKSFGFGFRDLVDLKKSKKFWHKLRLFRQTVEEEAEKYATVLGVNVPHTFTTIKPAGTTSKLFALTEGAHLPSMREYMRWVQFRSDDPLVEKYKKLGYPVKVLKSYHGSTAIGFPTQPEICKLGMGHKLVTAGEATPEEQYKYLMLMEKYFLGPRGNQVSYTLKYKPEKVSYEEFKEMILKYQSKVRCCSVMPQVDATVYEYQPEESITKEEFVKIVKKIKDSDLLEDISLEHLQCASGACPI